MTTIVTDARVAAHPVIRRRAASGHVPEIGRNGGYLDNGNERLVYMPSVPAEQPTMDPTTTEQTQPAAGPGRRVAQGIARGAAIIAGLTILSRILGLARTLVFSQSIGAGCLGTAYTTANQVPSLIYELAIGGALTSAMVPVLARSAEHAGSSPEARQRVTQITSALLTWAVIILVPLTVAIAAAARPVAALLNPANPNADCPHGPMISSTTGLLVTFAPQVFLYGMSVVLFGLLQAYRKFTGPALAPVVANVVLITVYLLFVPLNKGLPVGSTPRAAGLLLGIGTTLNIAALVVVPAFPAWRLKLRVRPALKFPPGAARQAGGLALVGVIELVAQDILNVVVIAVANGRGDTGALVLVNYTTQVFNAVFGVLALAIVTSAFPVLSARDGEAFDRTSAGSTRAVLLLSWLGTALIAAVAVPLAHVLTRQPDQVRQMIEAFALIAPGVAGLGVVTNLSRVMFVLGRLKVAAVALSAISLAGVVLDVTVARMAPPAYVVAALAAASTVANTAVALPMVRATRKIRGAAALSGVGRANLVGIAAAVVASAAGIVVSLSLPLDRRLLAGGSCAVAALAALVVFAAVAFLLDKEDLRSIARRARRRGLSPPSARLSRTGPWCLFAVRPPGQPAADGAGALPAGPRDTMMADRAGGYDDGRRRRSRFR
jgi:putative peptidoglycan lipid II flippase